MKIEPNGKKVIIHLNNEEVTALLEDLEEYNRISKGMTSDIANEFFVKLKTSISNNLPKNSLSQSDNLKDRFTDRLL